MIKPNRQAPKAPIQSPLDLGVLFSEAQRIQVLRAQMEQDHEEHMARVTSALDKVHEAISHAKTIQKGNDGLTPIKGIHYFDGEKGEPGKDGETPVIDYKEIAKQLLPLLPKVKDGKDGKSPTLKEIYDYLKENLKVEHIPGLANEIASYRNQLSGKHYGRDTMARGGGDTVAAGSGVTISNANGVKTISASASTFYSEQLTDSGDHKNFTALHTINTVFTLQDGSGKGIPPKDGSGNVTYTKSGNTITLASADANLASIGLFIVYA